MYTGIGVFALSLVSLLTYSWSVSVSGKTLPRIFYALSLTGCVAVMCWSAHLGGSITHGEHFLDKYAPWKEKKTAVQQVEPVEGTDVSNNDDGNNDSSDSTVMSVDESNPTAMQQSNNATPSTENTEHIAADADMGGSQEPVVATVTDTNEESQEKQQVLSEAEQQNARLFVDKVEPILAARCYECHGAAKQKSDLRLDSPQFIRIGGNGGKVIFSGQPERSSLYTLTILEADDPDIMPSKGDVLTKEETELIRTWILGGAFFGDEGGQENQAEKRAADTRVSAVEKDSSALGKPDAEAITALRAAGANINVLSSNGALIELDIRFVNQQFDKIAPLVSRVKDHVYWIDCGRTEMNDAGMKVIAQCKQLRRLYLHETAVTDASMAVIAGFKQLEVLNLYKCQISDAGIKQLYGLKELQKIYLWQTSITDAGANALARALPQLDINRGQ
jgi:hypothetical protein